MNIISADNTDAVIKSLEEVLDILFKCFSNDLMETNVGKSHFLEKQCYKYENRKFWHNI